MAGLTAALRGGSARFPIRAILVALIVLVALGQRLKAVHRLPVDADEPVYLQAASDYASLMAQGQWAQIPHYVYNSEHPVFAKLLYALGLRMVGYTGQAEPAIHLSWGDAPSRMGPLIAARYVAVFFGTLQVLALALADPLAGALLAIHTMASKYTAEVYLEAVPAFAVTLSVLAYERAHRRGEGQTGAWFWLSAGMLGMAAASKVVYGVVGLALAPFVVWQERRRLWNALAYGLLALAVFVALNPILWPDPLRWLRSSILYHSAYTASAEVARYAHPWWQGVVWMSGAATWHPDVFWFPFDFFTFLLSLAGLPFLFRQNKRYFAWFAVGWLFLFLWPTRWPQYTLIVTPVLCLSVAAIGRAVAQRYDLHFDRETWERISYYLPDHTFWIKPSRSFVITVLVLALVCGGAYAAYYVIRARQLRGWTTYSAGEGTLTSSVVTALALDADGRVWVGTRNGVTVYNGDQPTFLQAANTALIDNRVTALASDPTGRVWVGTESGVNVVQGTEWAAYTAAEMGLPEARVRALAADPQGRVWVGTRSGVSLWDGAGWRTFSPVQAGLDSAAVLALATDGQGRIWLGTGGGLAVLDLSGREPEWVTYTVSSSAIASNAILALAADPQGRMWVGTGGGGLCCLDPDTWTCYRTSNSDLPWNTVAVLMVDRQGRLWAATEKPTEFGGAVAVFDDHRWQVYTPLNSGLTSDAVSAILEDREGRFWFGTFTRGVSVFQPPAR